MQAHHDDLQRIYEVPWGLMTSDYLPLRPLRVRVAQQLCVIHVHSVVFICECRVGAHQTTRAFTVCTNNHPRMPSTMIGTALLRSCVRANARYPILKMPP